MRFLPAWSVTSHSGFVRAIFTAREWALGAEPADMVRLPGLTADMRAVGWRVLAETPRPGIVLIRRFLIRNLKIDAEGRARWAEARVHL